MGKGERVGGNEEFGQLGWGWTVVGCVRCRWIVEQEILVFFWFGLFCRAVCRSLRCLSSFPASVHWHVSCFGCITVPPP